MKMLCRIMFCLLFILILALGCCLAQGNVPNAPSFTFMSNFLGSPVSGATSGLDVGAAYQFTTYSRLRADVWSIPAAGSESFLFGTDIDMWFACKALDETALPCNKLNPYFGGAGGFGRVSVNNNQTVDKPAAMLRLGANFDPTGSGHFSLNVFEVDCGTFPVLSSTLSVKNVFKCGYTTGINFGLGTSQTASAKKLEHMRIHEAKKLKKLQKAAQQS